MGEKFTPVVDNEESGIVKCNACGCQFDWDVHSEQNLAMDIKVKHLVLVCPACDHGHPLCTCGEKSFTIYGDCATCFAKHAGFTKSHIPEHTCVDDGGMFFGCCTVCGRQLD